MTTSEEAIRGDLLRDLKLTAGANTYRLRMWSTNLPDKRNNGRTRIAYAFERWTIDGPRVIFSGCDYREYFDDYTTEQMEFAQSDAEELSLYTMEPEWDPEEQREGDPLVAFTDWTDDDERTPARHKDHAVTDCGPDCD